MPTNNQLIQCPHCGELEGFYIAAKVNALVGGTGDVEDTDSIEWEPTSRCQCRACGFVSIVEAFEEAAKPRRKWVVTFGYDDGSGDVCLYTALVTAHDRDAAEAKARQDFTRDLGEEMLEGIGETSIVEADWSSCTVNILDIS